MPDRLAGLGQRQQRQTRGGRVVGGYRLEGLHTQTTRATACRHAQPLAATTNR